ncbi:E3 ubiquitin-protein ligase RNF180-like isoform X1 [Limulus polyphemus]|uniref:E3 ubiquitin-protein ligase RNF180-like isoform X1 n=2 Tax=Limulus polyphemus TaxID=6850 RepID=A0ABM1BI36_LIMPO|nr:E3 ubiquitin-protein ligase RNF180-like isoform X1 [Limulus polyphemus]
MVKKMQGTTFKCKKCRRILFCGEIVVNSHCESESFAENTVILQSEGFHPTCNSDTVWYLKEENLQDWMIEQIDQGDWIKGKLTCPKCHGRIGSFDFVCGFKCYCEKFVLPPVHVVKSKVDYCPGNERQLQIKKFHGKIVVSPPKHEIEPQENDPNQEVRHVGSAEGPSSSTNRPSFSTGCLHHQKSDTCEKESDGGNFICREES